MTNEQVSAQDVLAVIRDNAIALLHDAELLFNAERWSRATALAVLSIEESGKYFLQKQGQKLNRSANLHGQKQRSVTSRHQAEVMLDTLEAALERDGLVLKPIGALTSVERAWIDQQGGPERSMFLLAEKYGWISTMADAAARSASSAEFATLYQGGLSALKNAALYVDISKDGCLSSTPETIPRNQSEAVLALARWCVSRLG